MTDYYLRDTSVLEKVVYLGFRLFLTGYDTDWIGRGM